MESRAICSQNALSLSGGEPAERRGQEVQQVADRTGWLGILDSADIQPVERLSYFRAYLVPDPEAAVAERARTFLESRQIQRILALTDPKERVQALLPFYAQPGPSIDTARKGIAAAGQWQVRCSSLSSRTRRAPGSKGM